MQKYRVRFFGQLRFITKEERTVMFSEEPLTLEQGILALVRRYGEALERNLFDQGKLVSLMIAVNDKYIDLSEVSSTKLENNDEILLGAPAGGG